MLEWIKKLFHIGAEESSDELNQDQREAIVDLLLLAMYADNKLTFKEDEFFKAETHRFAWDSVLTLDNYIDDATVKVRNALQAAMDRKEFLASIAARLSDPNVRDRALELCERLLICDEEGRDQEVVFFREISDALGKTDG